MAFIRLDRTDALLGYVLLRQGERSAAFALQDRWEEVNEYYVPYLRRRIEDYADRCLLLSGRQG